MTTIEKHIQDTTIEKHIQDIETDINELNFRLECLQSELYIAQEYKLIFPNRMNNERYFEREY